jgi:protein PhnA
MAKGFDNDQARKSTLSLFGKDLARRAKSKCELCEDKTSLSIYELPPVTKEPEYDNCIFICDSCRENINDKKMRNSNHWRCLNGALWSEVPVVQVMSIRLLQRLSNDHQWAHDMLDQAYPSEEIQAWVDLTK